MVSMGGGGWVYCPHCDCLTSVLSGEWGAPIECTICDESFTPEKGD